MLKKTNIKEFHYMKAISAIGIIIYHYSCRLRNRDFLPLYNFKNGSWGGVFVTIFFMVSGALLYYNYEDRFNLKKFYIKRWISIFPMFYVAYLSFWIGNVIESGSVFYKGVKWTYALSILGMDGYLYENTTTYYILGEWFLGAIILLYAVFPLILIVFKKKPIITFMGFMILYVVFYGVPIINPHVSRSIVSCLLSFVCGMLLIRYKDIVVNKCVFLLSIFCCIVLLCVKIGISEELGFKLMGLALYCLIFKMCGYIKAGSVCDKVVLEVSKNSYAIFLLQHITILKIVNAWNPTKVLNIFALLFITIILIVCEAKILTFVTNGFVREVKHRYLEMKDRLLKRNEK